MEYKIIALDIDGTVTNNKKEVTEKTKNSILEAQRNGKKVVLASGRPTHGILEVADILELDVYGNFILAFNGAKIINYKTKEIVFSQTLPRKVIKSIYEDAVSFNVGLLTYAEDNIIAATKISSYMQIESDIVKMPIVEVDNFSEYVDFDVNKCLMTGEPNYLEGVEKKLSKKYDGVLNIFRSEPFFLEIMPKGVDKANSLEHLLAKLNFEREELIAVGDGFNDKSMIELAGLGVAMANAQDLVKESADFITLSNENDGVAHVINKYMF